MDLILYFLRSSGRCFLKVLINPFNSTLGIAFDGADSILSRTLALAFLIGFPFE